MNRTILVCLLATAAAAATGCQHTPPSVEPDSRVGPLVGQDELLRTGRPWLFDALRVVRPNYFSSRGAPSLLQQNVAPMVVVIDGLVLPDMEPLRNTPVSSVAQVRRLTPSETYFRYNRAVSIGALEVVLRK
jgi:hypothetical protein